MARCVLAVAFGALGLAEVVGYTLPGNRRSRGVLEATGFSLAGELVHAGLPHLLYRLPAEAWRRR
jgi:RimJ/RimL family protein N-acetyltransferase